MGGSRGMGMLRGRRGIGDGRVWKRTGRGNRVLDVGNGGNRGGGYIFLFNLYLTRQVSLRTNSYLQ
jgi:hypothetical protein